MRETECVAVTVAHKSNLKECLVYTVSHWHEKMFHLGAESMKEDTVQFKCMHLVRNERLLKLIL